MPRPTTSDEKNIMDNLPNSHNPNCCHKSTIKQVANPVRIKIFEKSVFDECRRLKERRAAHKIVITNFKRISILSRNCRVNFTLYPVLYVAVALKQRRRRIPPGIYRRFTVILVNLEIYVNLFMMGEHWTGSTIAVVTVI